MRIAFILSGLSAGGAERVVSLVASHWATRGHDVVIITFDHPDHPIYHPLAAAVRVRRLGIRSGAMPGSGASRAILHRVRSLRAALKAERPDAIISFLFKINVLALLAARGLGTPVAVAERNHPAKQRHNPLWSLLRRLTYRRADLLLLQTEASRAALPAELRGRGLVIHNPISTYPRSPEPVGEKVLAAVGRLDPQKGFDLLLDAFAGIAARHPEWRLTIWGEGPERSALEARVTALGIEELVRLPGVSRSSREWIAGASAFVLSSRFEGFPNALGEAMAAGLPVAACDCEFGVGLLVTPGVDGLLVAADDAPALAAILDQLLDDRGLRARLGEAARLGARRFHAEKILRRWDAMLYRLVAAPLDPID